MRCALKNALQRSANPLGLHGLEGCKGGCFAYFTLKLALMVF